MLLGHDLNLLRALLVLDEERSVTRAAKRLGVTQSAASRSLQRLRDTVGDPLFLRTRAGMEPTPRAVELIRRVRPAVEELSAALLERPVFEPAAARRTFTFAMADYGQAVLAPPLLARVGREAPGVDVVIVSPAQDLVPMVVAGELDLLVGPRRDDRTPGMVWRGLFRERFACVLREGHPALKGKLTLQRFASTPQLLVAPTGRPGGIVDEVLAARGLKRRVALRLSSFLSAPYVVASTDLLLTIPERLAASFARGHPVTVVKPPVEIAGFDISLGWHERLRRDPGHAWFRRVVEEVGRGLER